MAEIRVDPAELAALASSLQGVRAGISAAPQLMAEGTACLGDHRLAAALHDVIANWSGERARLDELLAKIAAGAQEAAIAYARVDAAVAGACGGPR